MIKLVVGGGQSGADLAGNEFASEVGIPTIVFAFSGFKPLKKEDELLLNGFQRVDLPMQSPNDYAQCLRDRTVFNVHIADATVIFVEQPIDKSRGSVLTATTCALLSKPCHVVELYRSMNHANKLRHWLVKFRPTVLNVAGQRTCDRRLVKEVLLKTWEGMKRKER